MLRSRSQWAQADAAGCLGWLVGHIQGAALHELLPLATRLMVKHTTTDDEVFIREEERQRHKQDREKWGGRNRGGSSKSGGGSSGGGGGGGGSKSFGGSGAADEEQARERMDNIRVYTLIFLLKVRDFEATRTLRGRSLLMSGRAGGITSSIPRSENVLFYGLVFRRGRVICHVCPRSASMPCKQGGETRTKHGPRGHFTDPPLLPPGAGSLTSSSDPKITGLARGPLGCGNHGGSGGDPGAVETPLELRSGARVVAAAAAGAGGPSGGGPVVSLLVARGAAAVHVLVGPRREVRSATSFP